MESSTSTPFPKDILARLRTNKLKYNNEPMQPGAPDRPFGGFPEEQPVSQQPPDFEYINKKRSYTIFKTFLSKNGWDEMDKNRNWLFQKRLMMMVDRRGNTPPDNLWFVVFHDVHHVMI